jgi:teichuronic acid biosynthesis glycosyltransferase TuaG
MTTSPDSRVVPQTRVDVSVVTPAHNSARTIARCIGSVVGQTILPIEHIVIDDGSNDGTAELLAELAVKHDHVSVIAQPNRGAGAARNAGIEQARGRIIAFLDSDDEWLPDKLERQIRFMTEQQATFSYGDYGVIDAESGQRIGTYRMPDSLSHRALLRGCPIGCLTAAFDQKALGKVYMPDVRRGQDWGFWLALTRDGTIARRYPGCAALYYFAAGPSLSSNKLAKAVDIYRIYREQERMSVLASAWYLVQHSLSAVRKSPNADSIGQS